MAEKSRKISVGRFVDQSIWLDERYKFLSLLENGKCQTYKNFNPMPKA